MAFRFRKFRQSMRLIPSTKSFGFSTRVNEGDQANNSSTSSDGGSPSKLHGQCNLDDTNNNRTVSLSLPPVNNLYPLTRLASQSDALQLVEALPSSLKHHDISVSSLACLRSNVHPTFDDSHLHLLMSTAKPVALTCDDILPISADHNKNNPTDLTWERISVKYVSPSARLKSGSLEDSNSTYHMNFLNFSDFHPDNHYFSCNVQDKATSCYSNDSDSFHAFLFSSPTKNSNNDGGEANKNGPSAEQLHIAREKLEKSIPQIFSGGNDYSLLHRDVVFENNLFGNNRVLRGVNAYAIELMKLRFRFYARFTSTHMEVLNVTTHEQNGIIRIHWRLKGLPQTQVLKFWRLFQTKQGISKDDWEWIEAFSYFHIGKDGLVHKHRIDRMLPDNEEPNKLSERLTKLLNPAKPLVS